MSGRVQGVGFRYYVVDVAERLAVRGVVRNLRSGQVEVVAEGGDHALRLLVEAIREGPPGARVTDVELEWLTPTGEFRGFAIGY